MSPLSFCFCVRKDRKPTRHYKAQGGGGPEKNETCFYTPFLPRRPPSRNSFLLVFFSICLCIFFPLAFFFSRNSPSNELSLSLSLKKRFSKRKKTPANLRGDLLLELLDVGQQLLAARLEEQVAVDEPRGVAEADELEQLGQQRHGVDGANDGGREPQEDDGAAGVEEGRGLVLNGVPLRLEKERRGKRGGGTSERKERAYERENERKRTRKKIQTSLPSAGCP